MKENKLREVQEPAQDPQQLVQQGAGLRLQDPGSWTECFVFVVLFSPRHRVEVWISRHMVKWFLVLVPGWELKERYVPGTHGGL